MSNYLFKTQTSIARIIINIKLLLNNETNTFPIEIDSQMHVGGLMLRLVEQIEFRHDWSDYAFWWPLRNTWLLRTSETLEQCGLTSNDTLEFTTKHKQLRIRMPSFQTICIQMNFSRELFHALIQLCKEINLKHAEEWSLLRVGTQHEHENNESTSTNVDTHEDNLDTSHNTSEITSLSSENLSINSTNLAYSSLNQFNLHKHLKQMNIKYKSIYDKTYFNYFWLDSSKSLMEQNINENDVLYLKLKYFNLCNLSTQHDQHVRINQIYEQAKWCILSEETECTDEELIHFAGIQLQIQVQSKHATRVSHLSQFNSQLNTSDNDIDAALNKLEKDLHINDSLSKSLLNDAPEIGEELELMKPKYTFKKFKRYYFQLKDIYLSYFKSKEDLLKKCKPLDKLNLKDSQLIPDLNVKSKKFSINVRINDDSHGETSELYLRFSTQQSYVKWVAAFKLATKGKTIANLDSYQFEIESINNLIEMQKKSHNNTHESSSSSGDFQAKNFVTHRLHKKIKTKQLTDRIIEAHANLTHLDLIEAKISYIREWQTLPDYGITYFLVKISPYHKNAREVLGINPQGLVQFNSDGVKVKKWSFNNMKTWLVNWETNEFDIEFDEREQLRFVCLNRLNPKIIHEFIGGYIYMSMRNSSSNNHIDTQLFFNLTDKR